MPHISIKEYDFIVLLQVDTVVNIHSDRSISRDAYNLHIVHLCDIDEGIALSIFFLEKYYTF
jgi:hypothetical protein